MTRLALNKSSLSRQISRLNSFQRFLPSLDMKRKQLMVERAKARAELEATLRELKEIGPSIGRDIPMLANEKIDLTDLAKVTEAEIEVENQLGTKLPVLRKVTVERRPYSKLAKPHWVDRVADLLARALELEIMKRVQERRFEALEHAVQVVTQRVNLFDKVLIPRTKANIKRIKIVLADAERAAVVRAKIAKSGKNKQVAS